MAEPTSRPLLTLAIAASSMVPSAFTSSGKKNFSLWNNLEKEEEEREQRDARLEEHGEHVGRRDGDGDGLVRLRGRFRRHLGSAALGNEGLLLGDGPDANCSPLHRQVPPMGPEKRGSRPRRKQGRRGQSAGGPRAGEESSGRAPSAESARERGVESGDRRRHVSPSSSSSLWGYERRELFLRSSHCSGSRSGYLRISRLPSRHGEVNPPSSPEVRRKNVSSIYSYITKNGIHPFF